MTDSAHGIKSWFKMRAAYRIGDGEKISFWDDVWCGKCPLKTTFRRLFQCCNQHEATVAEVCDRGESNLTFRKSFCPEQVEEWFQLLDLLSSVELRGDRDEVKWTLEKSGVFPTKSLYKFMTLGGCGEQ